jgi:hypothetical protein
MGFLFFIRVQSFKGKVFKTKPLKQIYMNPEISMKRVIFDFDGTLFGEGSGNQRWLELYDYICGLQPEKIWLFSNGSKWLSKQSQSTIAFEHIDDFSRNPEDLFLAEAAIEHAQINGYAGLPENAALVKRAPEGSILVDDLAETWVAIAKSCAEHTLTPAEFLKRAKDGSISLTIDDQGYLMAC